MDIHRKLESVKDKKSYSSPAKRTMEKLKPILSQSEKLSERWIWELLQNASDLGDNITAKFYVSDDKLKFVHNGTRFKLEEAFNLIMPDSNKDEEEVKSEVKKDMIGQFGTGFISTHVLSSNITVKGIVEEERHKYNFEFCLDRLHRTDKSKLIDSIKKSESEYRNSLIIVDDSEIDEFSTQFIYDLVLTYDGLDSKIILDKGISALIGLLPYVLPLRTQLSKVEIHDIRDNKNEVLTFTCEDILTDINDLTFFDTTCEFSSDKSDAVTRVAAVKYNNVDVLCPVSKISESKYSIDKLPSLSPKIYCAFPMVGSDINFFPVVINCAKFVPNTERNGIEISVHDIENRKYVSEAVKGFCRLVQIVDDHNWHGGFNLFNFSKIDFGNPVTNKWYNENLFNQLVQKLKIAKLIRDGDSYYSVAKTYLPYYDKRSNDSEKQLIKIYKFGSKLLTYALPGRDVLFQWYNAVDYELYGAHKLTIDEIVKVLAQDSKSLASLKKKTEKDPERVKHLIKFVKYLVEYDKVQLLNKFEIIPNQNDEFRLLSKLSIDNISHKLLDLPSIINLKEINSEINIGSDIKNDLIHSQFQTILKNEIEDRDITFEKLCRLIDDGIKDYKGDYRDKKFVSILKIIFTWLNATNFSDELILRYFPYFGKEKSQLYLNTKSSEELEYTFDIDISGKGKALAKIAKSKLTTSEIETIASNSKMVVSFLKWVNQRVDDNPNEELGEIGEEFLYKELCNIFDIHRVKWEKKREYDFRILKKDLNDTMYYIDAKTTMKGLGNTENIPFYMRTAQWEFLEKEDAYGKYVIARLEKKGNEFSVKYLKIGIESVK